jgi:hypothetical protein
VNVTTELVSPEFEVTPTFAEILEASSGSKAGYSAVSEWLTCPERARLKALGVRSVDDNDVEYGALSALAFGTLCHHLRALRIQKGQLAVELALSNWKDELPEASWLKAKLIFRVYESLFPREEESFQVLGIESEVCSEVGQRLDGEPILRTVRYDTVVRLQNTRGEFEREVYSFEAKTMARSGMGSIEPYIPQAMVQTAIWNANPALVEQFGPMRGVLFDCLLKTDKSGVERIGPLYYSARHQQLAREYLCQADNGMTRFGVDEHGRYPRNLHACFGRWRKCSFMEICLDGAYLNFHYADGRPYDGR